MSKEIPKYIIIDDPNHSGKTIVTIEGSQRHHKGTSDHYHLLFQFPFGGCMEVEIDTNTLVKDAININIEYIWSLQGQSIPYSSGLLTDEYQLVIVNKLGDILVYLDNETPIGAYERFLTDINNPISSIGYTNPNVFLHLYLNQ